MWPSATDFPLAGSNPFLHRRKITRTSTLSSSLLQAAFALQRSAPPGASAQKQFFQENGFLIVPDILSPAQMQELREMVDKMLNGEIRPEFNEPGKDEPLDDFQLQLEPAAARDPAMLRREKIRVAFHLCHTHPYFRRHATRPEILNVVENLLGLDVKLYTDQMFVKPPHHGSEVPFHQDHAYWTMMEPYNAVSCWLALDDVTLENGCVRMVPGTHHKLVPHHEFEGPQALGLLNEEVEAEREVPVEIKAGSAMFHHSLTIHRSFPNTSAYGRRGLVTIYMPGDSHLVQPWDFHYGFRPARELAQQGT
jgi:ectoine hydroxylase-related dioxygenase (phytanoyl-CoA dioxygenase family)